MEGPIIESLLLGRCTLTLDYDGGGARDSVPYAGPFLAFDVIGQEGQVELGRSVDAQRVRGRFSRTITTFYDNVMDPIHRGSKVEADDDADKPSLDPDVHVKSSYRPWGMSAHSSESDIENRG